MESIPSLRLCEFIHRIPSYFAVLYRSTLLRFDEKDDLLVILRTDVRTACYISALSALVLSA
jgi:hypothetical protein